jgi:hypothetical protein
MLGTVKLAAHARVYSLLLPPRRSLHLLIPSSTPLLPPYSSRSACALQGFNWESWKHNWFDHIAHQAQELAQMGFTTVWLPPFTDSVSEQGYMPRDLYNLNSRYGSESQLIK